MIEAMMNEIYNSVRVPLHWFEKNGVLKAVVPDVRADIDPIMTDKKLLDGFSGRLFAPRTNPDEPIIICTSNLLIFAALRSNSQDDTFFVLGPFTAEATYNILTPQMAKEHGISDLNAFEEFLFHRISPASSFRKVLSVCAMVYCMEWGKPIGEETLSRIMDMETLKVFNVYFPAAERLFFRREDFEAESPYKALVQLAQYTASGDTESALKYYKSTFAPAVKERNLDLGRDENPKHYLYALVSLATHLSISTGVAQNAAIDLWSLFCSKIDECKTELEHYYMYLSIIMELSERIPRAGKPRLSRGIRSAAEYISEHLHEEIRLNDVADACGLNPNYLSNLFRKETGLSVTDYILSERIHESKSLLQYTNMTMLEISSCLSFSSQSHFSSAFKKKCGMSPMEYRAYFKAAETSDGDAGQGAVNDQLLPLVGKTKKANKRKK